MMLTNDQVRTIADDVFGAALSNDGFVKAIVETRDDDIGEPALFVTALFRPGGITASGERLSKAAAALRARLRKEGEARFSYFAVDADVSLAS